LRIALIPPAESDDGGETVDLAAFLIADLPVPDAPMTAAE